MHRYGISSANLFGLGRLLAVAVWLGTVALIAGFDPTLAHEEHGHPARIHEGTCEDLGAVAFRLNGVGGSVDLDNAPVATPAAVNAETAYQVMTSESRIDGSLDELLSANYAVMVYESDEAMDAIACGNVGGAMSGDTLISGLAEMGVPGHLGFALFQPAGDGLAVTMILGHGLAAVSASGIADEHEHAEGEANEHEEQDAHGTTATPVR